MPHDSNGQPLKPGDRVTLEFEVKSISPSENACNVTLETVATLAAIQGGETYVPQLTLNSRFATLKAAVLLALGLLGFASITLAGDCNALYRQRVVYAAPVQAVVAQHYAAPSYLQYAVGSDIQAEAVAEKIAQKLAPKLQAMLAAPRSDAGTLSVRSPVAAPVLSAKCAKCHSGDSPKAGLTLDGSKPVDDASFRAIVRMLGKGEGVPKAMAGVVAGLAPTDKGAITEELLGMEAPHEAPPKPGELK